MRKLFVGILLAALVNLSACVPGEQIVVFGDSLAVESTAALKTQKPDITVNAYGGTTVCDWNTRMKQAIDRKPTIVIASFVGNSGTPCSGGAVGPTYWNNLFLHVMDISRYANSRGVALWWAAYPVRGANTFYKFGDWTTVQKQYQYAASQFPTYVKWFDAGLTVAPNHVYTSTIAGRAVRDPDKLHLTPYGAELYARELLKPAM